MPDSSILSSLCHDLADRSCRLDLHGVGGVGVGAEGEAGVGVAQHPGHRSDVHSALQSDRGESVPSVKNREKILENTKLYWQSPLKKGKFDK